ncbi:hypothetical protein KEM56_005118 [Ascosphaera pollenicola]|nr:hypothetical protein KEM56_005118 [Ascosphaera pollenicola]
MFPEMTKLFVDYSGVLLRFPSQIEKLVNLIPVGLKEAALDSPTFRASVVHFSDQVDIVERWLDGYVKSTSKLTAELSTLESLTGSFLSSISCPPNLSEAVVDYDYTLLGIKLYEESARAYWSSVLSSLRQSDHVAVEPIKAFINEEIRPFKVLQCRSHRSLP